MNKVVIYSYENCPYCKMAKEFFKKEKISFEEKDVIKDEKALKELIAISGKTTVPVFLIGKKTIIGYDIKKIKEALE